MATIDTHAYSNEFTGLIVSVEVSLGVLVTGLIVHDVVRRVKRDTIYWRSGGKARAESSEDWGFGYLYHDRSFVAHHPAPKLPSRWPLGWVLQCVHLDDSFYAEHSGLDSAVYIRFLRACWYYVLLHLFTTFPALFSVNWVHSPRNLSTDNLSRASLSSLILTVDGRRLLWLQILFLFWLSCSWAVAITWVGIGALQHRRNHLAKAFKERAESNLTSQPRAGWRFRTVCVQNIPSDLGLREKEGLSRYFDQGLCTAPADDEEAELPLEPTATEKVIAPSLVSEVVIVRRSARLQAQFRKRTEALHQLEAAHIQLARNVLRAVQQKLNHSPQASKEAELSHDSLIALVPYLDRSMSEHNQTVWEVLNTLPRQELDPYQPMYTLGKRFRGQRVPCIDYWTTKFNVLDLRVRQLRIDATPAASTAFVTFHTADDARRACRHMPVHPERLFAVKVRPAPDARDVIWEKIILVTFKSDVIRSIITHFFIWFATLVWVLPISLFLALVSLDNVAQLVPALANYLSHHSKAKSLLSTLVPTLIVSVISFFIPSILIQITSRAQHLFTVSKLHNRVGLRYYVWLMTNVVILFCVGSAAVQAVFTDPAEAFAPQTVLGRIAAAFPAAAPFFIGWQILTLGLQNGFEIMMLGYAWLGAHATRKAASPRKRYELSLPRQIFYYWWQSNSLLAFAIFVIFCLLNSLVIPFALPYYTAVLLVMKNQFLHVFFRRQFEGNGRLYMRFLRFSLDALMVTCVVFIAFFFINSQGGYGSAPIVVLVLLAVFKLAATRWFKAHMDALDIIEADIHTGTPLHASQDVVAVHLLPTFMKSVPGFQRFVLRVPAIALAPTASFTSSTQIRSSQLPIPAIESSAKEGAPPMTRQTISASEKSVSAGSDGSEEAKVLTAHAHAHAPFISEHPSLVRDDRPDFSASYEDPYYSQPLHEYLWLPRDPLSPLDLCDTVEYAGEAFVSTAARSGRLWQNDSPLLFNSAEGKSAGTPLADLKLSAEAMPGNVEGAPPPALGVPVASPASPASPASARRIAIAEQIGSLSNEASRPAWALGLRRPSFSPLSPHKPRVASSTSKERDSYFPHNATDISKSLPPAIEIDQSEALLQEVLEEEREDEALVNETECTRQEEESRAERRAASRTGNHSQRHVSGQSMLRRWANATDP